MSGTILVRGARQLLTLRGSEAPRRGAALKDLGIIKDGALLIDDGRIVQVGVSRRIENLSSVHGIQEIDATGQVVMPGFMDCHTHLIWGTSAPAGQGGGGASGEEDSYTPAPTLQALSNTSGKRLESRARQLVNGMIRHGTTSLEAKCGLGLDARSELKILRAQAKLDGAPLDIAATYLAPRTLPQWHPNGVDSYISWMCHELLPAIRQKTQARYAGLRWGENLDLVSGRRYLEAARGLGFELKIDAGEKSNEAIRLAVEVGAATVEHVRHAGAAETELLAHSGTMAVLLPGESFQQGGCSYATARDLIDGGAAVALGTNFHRGTSSTYSMQTVVALACARMGMSAEEAICAATFNAACGMGCGHTAGSLEAGKAADLIVLNASDYREIPHHFGVNLVNRTVKRGVTIYQEGKVSR